MQICPEGIGGRPGLRTTLLAAVLVIAGCAAPAGQQSEAAAAPAQEAPAAVAEPGAAVSYKNAALAAAEWIRSKEIRGPSGLAWPADPDDTGAVVTNLYTGTPGVVLFFIEAWRATGDARFLADAGAGADYLIDAVHEGGVQGAGLYTGLAGIGYTLFETYRATGEPRYRDEAEAVVDRILATARPAGAGLEWSETTDIISGSSGTGLFLLWAAQEMDRADALPTAEKAGRRLLELGERVATGTDWPMSIGYERRMPNFSHGTAGVAYFLARLYEETGEPAFLDASLSGARHLQEIAVTEGQVCLVYHDDEVGEDLFYLSWCHGPAGTGRTFYELWRVTGDDTWLDWLQRSANAIRNSGIPEQLTDGFWNNVGQCCGSAGVAEFFLALYDRSADATDLQFARRVADNMVARATPADPGLMWVQAEHRVRPDFLVAQTGFMQGAAGIGTLLLHLEGALVGRPPTIVLPDSPFAAAGR